MPHASEDQLTPELNINYLEMRFDNDQDPVFLDMDASISQGRHSAILALSIQPLDSRFEEVETQLLYANQLNENWQLQAGWRHDDPPTPVRDWAVLGLAGSAYFDIETGLFLFIGEKDLNALRLELDYQWRLAEHWVLAADFEANAHDDDDASLAVASGVSYVETGLRLHYQFAVRFSMYAGVVYDSAISSTRDLLAQQGEAIDNTTALFGLSAGF